MSIPFTQYLRPDGRQKLVEIARPAPVEAKARTILAAGYRFEAEHLAVPAPFPDVSLTIADPAREEDVAIELCRNGPDVLAAIDRLILNFKL